MHAPTQDREPSPTFGIDLPANSPRQARPVSHDRFTDISGRLELRMKVVSDYLYVGSGEFRLEDNEKAYYAFARRNGQLIIPGTSIKGAVRSIVEAISNSCVRLAARDETVPRSHEGCKDAEHLCPACRLFGTTGYRGRVHFSDAALTGPVGGDIIKISDLWPPRSAKGRKFYETKVFQPHEDKKPEKNHRLIEVVRKGSEFSSSLHFENVTPAEMGLLIRALGFDLSRRDPAKVVRAFPVKVGGAKPRCLGAVEITPRRLFLIPVGSDFLSALRTGGLVEENVQDAIQRYLRADPAHLLDERAWNDFCRQARPQDKGLCPKEVY